MAPDPDRAQGHVVCLLHTPSISSRDQHAISAAAGQLLESLPSEQRLHGCRVLREAHERQEMYARAQDMFAKAAHPERVFVAAVQQVLEFQEACWHTGLPWASQIRTITIPYSEARGPTHARHLAATLYRNEDYFLQIDAHTTFVQARALPACRVTEKGGNQRPGEVRHPQGTWGGLVDRHGWSC